MDKKVMVLECGHKFKVNANDISTIAQKFAYCRECKDNKKVILVLAN